MTEDSARDFEEFFSVEYPRLLRVLSAADVSAADALQEAFAKAAAQWTRISHYDNPGAWVRRVAVHRLLNERRSSRRRAAAVERLGALSGPDRVDREGLIDLATAIGSLPTRQRVALALFYLGDLTSTQTAEVMGISAGAVRFHLHQARNQLRDALGVRDE